MWWCKLKKPKTIIKRLGFISLKDIPIDKRTRALLMRMSHRLKKPPELLVARWTRDWTREFEMADRKKQRQMLESMKRILKSRRIK